MGYIVHQASIRLAAFFALISKWPPAERAKKFHLPNVYRFWWYIQGGPKNETTLVRPTVATVQDKIKRISLKCSQRLRK